MNVNTAVGVISGMGMGAGLWLLLARLLWNRRGDFSDRIASQLTALARQSKLLSEDLPGAGVLEPLERIIRLLADDASGWLARLRPGTAGLALRLERAGRPENTLYFRAVQVISVVAGLIVASVVLMFYGANGGFNLLLAFLVTITGGIMGLYAPEWLLNRQIHRRESRMLAEFPALAELMALAVGAGESVTGALERVCQNSAGPLAKEFSRILAQTRTGSSLADALSDFSRRSSVAPLIRFTEGLAIGVERGTPMVEVLRAQAQDVREFAKRQLIESAGKKEIAMMVPLVFGILPLTVIFAAFPGLQLLTFGL
ncbi:type II secretion system F family protein [Psychromicrobium lacuslunae]|uniref:Type II secretion system protein GspF domain-containing protein n=1 Tax=Psychromicrobium lacuslunae TaxID=1618207 RepID=A0A0D4BYI8_9MICC|nr:type II secretion system F family protein [Psychromicrobium lacuslunae]AJT41403.1 hypothetical protein UM93_07520 [Psychromicrobium lacuslunae]